MKARPLAWIGGSATMLLTIAAYMAVGRIYSDAKAIDLIGQLAQSALYFGSAIATASATTLALMLTLIGMARRSEAEFSDEFYRNVYRISALSTATLLGAVVLLLLLTLPVGEFDNLSAPWFIWLYRIQFAMVGILSSLLVATVLLVFATVRAVIINITPADVV
ncbi:hypothetical protein [Stakelama marina]|uniref:Uncharacterized protein n=1 Tax=Stakelama marina TaxID=2826939 RepID=A0A8T4IDM4_9SPHN|nr:hypothetical protein [Stakelama marina]MBR0552613.1 hypothetical protein [Stakelama marina]